jgi:hypothetical protein
MLRKKRQKRIELWELADIVGNDRLCLLCRICHEPVNLKSDTVTDENGNVKEIISLRRTLQ